MTEPHDPPIQPGTVSRGPGPRWWLPIAAVTMLATAGLASAPWLLADPARLSRVVAGAVPELDATVRFRSARVAWAGPIVFEGVRVEPRDGGTPPLTVERVEVEHGLASILWSFGNLGRVQATGLEVDVVYDEGRRANLSGLIRRSDNGASTAAARRRPSPLRMRLEIDGALVRIAGPWSGEPWQSEPIDVTATLAPAVDGPWSEWSLAPIALLTDARLEPGVAQGVLAYIAPVLAGATRTSGRFSLRLDGARLPVGRPADGTLSGTLSMHEVVVGPGPLVENLLESLPVGLPRPPDIRIADESRVAFRLADRRVTHDGLEFGLPLARTGQRLDIRSSGSVGIDDGSLDLQLKLPVPTDLPSDRPVLAALAGKAVSVGIRGELGRPRVEFDGSIKAAAGEFVGDLLDRVRAGSGVTADADGPSTGDATGEAVVDIVAGILEEVAKRRAERRAAEQANPEAVQPRRLRERLRAGRGPDPQSNP